MNNRNIKVFLSLGSNIGDRASNILFALSFLHSNGILIKTVSNIYETSPIGPKQRNFYNICIEAMSKYKPFELLNILKNIEHIMGRKKTGFWGARIIDIDILFIGKTIIKSKKLNIPHLEIANRLFVLKPLCDIGQDFKHPIFSYSIKQLLKIKSLTLIGQKIRIRNLIF
jgi:2-amino-4-hydroxy-6-hydroxymethyldihydropteridine diphosphokinase